MFAFLFERAYIWHIPVSLLDLLLDLAEAIADEENQ